MIARATAENPADRFPDVESFIEELHTALGGPVVGQRDGRSVSGTRFGDFYAALGERRDGTQEASLVSLERGASRVVLTVETAGAGVVHPTLDGGLHVMDDDGILRTYDSGGVLTGEIQTGAPEPWDITLDPGSGRLAIITPDTALIVDPTTEEVEILPGGEGTASFGFAKDGELLALVGASGTVRLWDVERGRQQGWYGREPEPQMASRPGMTSPPNPSGCTRPGRSSGSR